MRKLGLLILLTSVILITGCISSEDQKADEFQEQKKGESSELDVDKLIAQMDSDTVEFDFEEIKTFDLDNDGSDDRYVFTFKTDEVTKGLFLEKKIEYEKQNDGLFQGEIVLRFDNTGYDGGYLYIENIPKEFASNVDDLEFSVTPTEILEADPKVSWKINAKNSEIHIKSAEKRAQTEVRKTLEEIVIEEAMKECEKLEGREGVLCLLEIVRQYRHNEMMREEIYNISGNSLLLNSVLRAVLEQDLMYCSIKLPEAELSLCRELVLITLIKDCKEKSRHLTDDERDLCISLVAIDKKNVSLCEKVKDISTKNACLGAIADVTNNVEICEKIEVTYETYTSTTGERVRPEDGYVYTYARDACFYNYALRNDDITACEKIIGDVKDVCFLIFAVTKDDASICEKIDDETSKLMCFAGVEHDKKYCEEIDEYVYKIICLATVTQDKDYCKELIGEARWSCCDKLTDEKSKEECLELRDEEESVQEVEEESEQELIAEGELVDCEALYDECLKGCKAIAKEAKKLGWKAAIVFDCREGLCSNARDSKYCEIAGYAECVEPLIKKYHSCLRDCIAEYNKTDSVEEKQELRNWCNSECYCDYYAEIYGVCKLEACSKYCKQKGYTEFNWKKGDEVCRGKEREVYWSKCECSK